MNLTDLLQIIITEKITGKSDIEISGIQFDSRLLRPAIYLWLHAVPLPMDTNLFPWLPFKKGQQPFFVNNCHKS